MNNIAFFCCRIPEYFMTIELYNPCLNTLYECPCTCTPNVLRNLQNNFEKQTSVKFSDAQVHSALHAGLRPRPCGCTMTIIRCLFFVFLSQCYISPSEEPGFRYNVYTRAIAESQGCQWLVNGRFFSLFFFYAGSSLVHNVVI